MPQSRQKLEQKRLAKKPRVEYIRPGDLSIDRPADPGLVETLGKVMTGEIVSQTRRVPAHELVVRDEDINP